MVTYKKIIITFFKLVFLMCECHKNFNYIRYLKMYIINFNTKLTVWMFKKNNTCFSHILLLNMCVNLLGQILKNIFEKVLIFLWREVVIENYPYCGKNQLEIIQKKKNTLWKTIFTSKLFVIFFFIVEIYEKRKTSLSINLKIFSHILIVKTLRFYCSS